MTVQWQEQVSLKPYNTFGIDVKARYFTQAHDDQEVRLALAQAQQGAASEEGWLQNAVVEEGVEPAQELRVTSPPNAAPDRTYTNPSAA